MWHTVASYSKDILMEYNNVILRVIDPANISTVATLLQEQLKGAHAATVHAMRARYPRWTDELMQRKRLKYAKGRPLETMLAPKRQRLEERAMASAFAVIIQGYEDESLMTAAQVLEEGGWMVHSYQQDGV